MVKATGGNCVHKRKEARLGAALFCGIRGSGLAPDNPTRVGTEQSEGLNIKPCFAGNVPIKASKEPKSGRW